MERPYVAVHRDVRPIPAQNVLAVRTNFALKNNLGTSALKTKIKASDPGKK